jgi:hypothetical protein
MVSVVNVDQEVDGLKDSTKLVVDTVEALLEAGAPAHLVEGLVSAVQSRGAWLVLARKAYRDAEFYPYFPESYGPESETYDEVAQLLAASTLQAPSCGECGHPKAEHRDGECRFCGYILLGSIARKHPYAPGED